MRAASLCRLLHCDDVHGHFSCSCSSACAGTGSHHYHFFPLWLTCTAHCRTAWSPPSYSGPLLANCCIALPLSVSSSIPFFPPPSPPLITLAHYFITLYRLTASFPILLFTTCWHFLHRALHLLTSWVSTLHTAFGEP